MKNASLLEIQGLRVRVEDKEILHGVDLTVGKDETHVLMGPNGTGKSTLGYAITGNPAYEITGGQILFEGEDITALPINEACAQGNLSFLPESTGSSRCYLKRLYSQRAWSRGPAVVFVCGSFKKKLKETMALLHMDESYAERDLNVGFSGGEKKKAEILQMLMLEPKLAHPG